MLKKLRVGMMPPAGPGNLLPSVLGMFDIQAERFGDSTGSLANI
jgi:hypothetical protein